MNHTIENAQGAFLARLQSLALPGTHFQVALKRPAKTRPGDVFACWAWSPGMPLPPGPWYFNAGLSDNKKLRKAGNMRAVICIVIDDVGTKVTTNPKATPSWVIETSPGNCQWGFLLETATTDIPAADALYAGLVAAGLQDKGVRHATRLFRIPDSVNDKPEAGGFTAVLHEWRPDTVYTLKSLAAALGVKPGKVQKPRVVEPVPGALGQPDPMFDWLVANGHVRHETTDGWWEIDCPWPEEHGDGRSEARYRPLGADDSNTRAVTCFHGHGQQPHAAEYKRRFVDWIESRTGLKWRAELPPISKDAQHVLREYAAAHKAVSRVVSAPCAPDTPPPPQPRKTTAVNPEMYTISSLYQAIGAIDIKCLPQTDKTKEGVLTRVQPVTYMNVEAGLANLGVQIKLNLMTGRQVYVLPARVDMTRFGSMTQDDIDNLIDLTLCDIFHTAGLRNKRELRDAFAAIANANMWHPMKDWIEAQTWDGKDRLELLAKSVDTPTPDVFRVYFRRWLLQGVEAVCGWERDRSVQKALVLVLAGPQGKGKTRWLMSLAPGYCVEGKHLALNGHNARDSMHQALQGAIVELGELDTTFSRADNGALKAFLSQTTDEYRLPYAEKWLRRPRCTSFCGSVNDMDFLTDPTGARRFLAVAITKCDPAHGVDMAQLWAQVYQMWLSGEQHWLTETEEAMQTASNADFQQTDTVAERIAEEKLRREDTAVYCMPCALGTWLIGKMFGLPYHSKADSKRIVDAMLKAYGPRGDFRRRGGSKDAWIVNLSRTEVDETGAKLVRPPVPPDWAKPGA